MLTAIVVRLQYYGFVLDYNLHDSEYLGITRLASEVQRAGIGSETDRLDRLTLLASLSEDSSLGLSQVRRLPYTPSLARHLSRCRLAARQVLKQSNCAAITSADCAGALRQALDSSRLVVTHGGPTTQLMMVARLLCLNRTALASEPDVRRLAGQLASGRYLDLDNEIAAWRLVASACRACVADMPTTLQYDVGLLEGGGLGAVMRTCVRYRAARKRLLAQAAARLDAFVEASRRVGRVCTILGARTSLVPCCCLLVVFFVVAALLLLCACFLPCR